MRLPCGRGTHVLRSGYDDNEAFLRRLSGEKEKTKHVKRENKPLALFLKTIFLKLFACEVFKDNRDNRDNFLCY